MNMFINNRRMSDIIDFQLGVIGGGPYIVIFPRGFPEPPFIILFMIWGVGGFGGGDLN